MEIGRGDLISLWDAMTLVQQEEWSRIFPGFMKNEIFNEPYFERRLIDLVTGKTQTDRSVFASFIERNHTLTISEIVADCMVQKGFDPFITVALSVFVSEGFSVNSNNTILIWTDSINKNTFYNVVSLDPKVCLIQSDGDKDTEELIIEVIITSDLFFANAAGEQLKRYISHPVLDKYDLIIKNVKVNKSRVDIIVKSTGRHLSVSELEEKFPNYTKTLNSLSI